MVKKVTKAKTTKSANQLKPSTSKKTTHSKSEGELLSNGSVSDPKTDTVENESNEVMDATQSETTEVQKNAVETSKQQIKASTSGEAKAVPKAQKRGAPVKDKKEPKKSTKAKKQKVLNEIPKINAVTGKVFVIGQNTFGQLGLGEDVHEKRRPAVVELPHSIVDIAAGGMHSVCLTEKGKIITFGCNDEGALGRITDEERPEYIPHFVDIPDRIVQVSAGDSHSAALSEFGQVYIWGNFRSGDGQMGLITPDTKQPTPVQILRGVKVVKISSGVDHLACLSQEGTVYTCGCASQGQLGRISERIAQTNGGRKGKGLFLTPDMVPVTRSTKNVVDNVWTGSFNTYVKLQESGSIYAFGLNNRDQLGIERRTEEEVVIWKPQLVRSFDNKRWLQINGGQHHALSLDEDGLVYSLGCSIYGKLGLETDSPTISEPTVIPALQEKKCVDISCGNLQSFAVTDNGSAFSWGFGENEQLGHGTDSDERTPRLIEGRFLESWRAIKISGGGQHTLILAKPRESLEEA